MRVQNLTANMPRPVKVALSQAAGRWMNKGNWEMNSLKLKKKGI